MVEIRVAVPDATRAPGLMRRLAGLFDHASVSFDGAQREVRVRSQESRGVVQVLRAIESWLAEDGPDSARLSIGDRTYTMLGPTGLGAPGRTNGVIALTPMLVTLTTGAGAVRHGHLDSRLRINGPRPRDLADRSFTVVSPVPIASGT